MNRPREGGYNDALNRSNRAGDAFARGLAPKSKIGRRHLDEVGFNHPLAFAKWLIERSVWAAAEWHHTGFRRRGVQETNFYDPADLKDIPRARLQELQAEWKRGAAPAGQKVKGKFPVFCRDYRRGAGRNDYRIDHWQEFKGELIGDWIQIAGGGKKKASGKYIEFEVVG